MIGWSTKLEEKKYAKDRLLSTGLVHTTRRTPFSTGSIFIHKKKCK